MSLRRAVQIDPTLLRYASAITEQKKCWELLAEKFDRFQSWRNNTQQLPTLLRQCWELLRACWQWLAKVCNNSQECWDLQCIVGRTQLISLCNSCVMSVRGPNNVGSNISNMRRSVSSPDATPRRELKIRRAAEDFWRTSRCFIW